MNNNENQNPGQEQDTDRKVQPLHQPETDKKNPKQGDVTNDVDNEKLPQDAKKTDKNINDLNDEDGLTDDTNTDVEQLH